MDDDTFTQIIAFIAIDFLIFVFIRTSSDGQKSDFLLATRVPSQLYAPQTKILEVRTNLSECFFEAIFNDS